MLWWLMKYTNNNNNSNNNDICDIQNKQSRSSGDYFSYQESFLVKQ
jgi:hypothetical protein